MGQSVSYLRTVIAVVATAVLATVVLTAGNEPPSPESQLPSTTITVSAASSLTDVFPVVAEAFTERYPDITVRFNFGPSNGLVEQVRAGAPIDVLATADEDTMRRATNDGLTESPLLFARNSLTIAVPKGNPAQIRSLADLEKPNVAVALCNPKVPCGQLAARLLAKNRLQVTPITREVDVRGVLGKVMADEVDAGVVYSTDVTAFPGDVDGVPIPGNQNVFTDYPIARVADSGKAAAADAFIDFVRNSSPAQQTLRAWGFSQPW